MVLGQGRHDKDQQLLLIFRGYFALKQPTQDRHVTQYWCFAFSVVFILLQNTSKDQGLTNADQHADSNLIGVN